MKKININKNYGTLFFITGLSGSGKSSISKKIAKKIERIYGPTFLYSGERVRNIFKFYGYSRKERIELGKKNIQFINYILKQKINVVYDAIALLKVLRKIKRKTIFPNDTFMSIYHTSCHGRCSFFYYIWQSRKFTA